MDKVVHNSLSPEEMERLKKLQHELEGQELTLLLERLQQQCDLSVNQTADAAGMDESALHKILKGENREFKASYVDALLEGLERQGKLSNPLEISVWKRALRISAYLHYDLYKSIEPRLRQIEDTGERIEALKTYLKEQYPTLTETYDKTGGTFPLFVPLFDVAARVLDEKWGKARSKTDFGTWQRPIRQTSKSVVDLPDNHLEIGGIRFIKIPAGKFIMGSKEGNELAYGDEHPQHTLELPEFFMARFPVTNSQYQKFTDASGYVTLAENVGRENSGRGGFEKGFNWRTPLGRNHIGQIPNHPVVQITWRDALAYVRWLNEASKDELPSGYRFILPTEAQWEKSARGEYGNEWPWGNEFDPKRCNSTEGGKGSTTPVDAYPSGASPYGVLDMVGNVWEWTHTLFKDYPYKADDGRESEVRSGRRVLRGGSFRGDRYFARCASRFYADPDSRGSGIGFRVAVSPISPG
jgi:formylglycine-generating enzyme required for sulfatase activity